MLKFHRHKQKIESRGRWGGGEMSVLRSCMSAAPNLIFSHATGMNAQSYRQMLSFFADKYSIAAMDHRGHGFSNLPTNLSLLNNWQVFSDDMASYIEGLEEPEAGWTIIGHSMGAVSALRLAAEKNIKIAKLVLIEPVIIPEMITLFARTPFQPILRNSIPIAKKAGQRRWQWEKREDAYNSYARKGFFKVWGEGVLNDYLDGGMRETENGVELSCHPKWEQATFGAQGQSFWAFLNKFLAKSEEIIILRGGVASTTGEKNAQRYRKLGVKEIYLPKIGHLAPQEDPQLIAEKILENL